MSAVFDDLLMRVARALGNRVACERTDGEREDRTTVVARSKPRRTSQRRHFFSCKLLKRIGGDDGTRTRGLCRDRAAF
jgi:hypothetical protein